MTMVKKNKKANRVRESLPSRIFDVFNVIFMLMMMIITLYPMLYVVFASVSDPYAVAKHSGMIYYPLQPLTLEAYVLVFKNPMIPIGYMNTIKYLLIGTTLNMFMTILGAYCFSRNGPMLMRPLTFVVIFTMYISGGLIPLYLLVRQLGIYNTTWAVILPTAVSTYNLIVMRTSFAAVPVSLEESARLDGANDLFILWRVVVPLSKPVIAVMILFYGVGHWNSWFPASIYFQDRTLYPLQLVLREILISSSTENMTTSMGGAAVDQSTYGEAIKYSTIMIATVPILCVYPFLQRFFVQGMMIGAVKG